MQLMRYEESEIADYRDQEEPERQSPKPQREEGKSETDQIGNMEVFVREGCRGCGGGRAIGMREVEKFGG